MPSVSKLAGDSLSPGLLHDCTRTVGSDAPSLPGVLDSCVGFQVRRIVSLAFARFHCEVQPPLYVNVKSVQEQTLSQGAKADHECFYFEPRRCGGAEETMSLGRVWATLSQPATAQRTFCAVLLLATSSAALIEIQSEQFSTSLPTVWVVSGRQVSCSSADGRRTLLAV